MQETISGHVEFLPNGVKEGMEQERMNQGLLFHIDWQLNGAFGPECSAKSTCIGAVSLEKLKAVVNAERMESLVIEV